MSTNPRATIEYMTPASRPPTRTSRKKADAIGTSGREPADVRFDDGGIRPHGVRRVVRNLSTVIEDDDVIGQLQHDAQVVLDEHQRRPERLVSADQEAAHVP